MKIQYRISQILSILGIFCLILTLSLLPQLTPIPKAKAAIIIVGPGQSINNAIHNLANPGDIVRVQAGHYNEHVRMRDNIDLISIDGPSQTYIESPAVGLFSEKVLAANATLSGFTIQDGIIGVYSVSKTPTITNNIIQNNTDVGIGLWDSIGTIHHNTIQSNINSGVYFINNSDGLLYQNKIKHHQVNPQVRVNNSSPKIISNLICSASTTDATGIEIIGSSDNPIVSGNIIDGCNNSGADGIFIDSPTSNPQIFSNYISNILDNGIEIDDSTNAMIADNEVSQTNDGINIFDPKVTPYGNYAHHNTNSGINILSSDSSTNCSHNVLTHNTYGIRHQPNSTANYYQNIFDQNQAGFYNYDINGPADPKIWNNIFTHNTTGIYSRILGGPGFSGNDWNNFFNNTNDYGNDYSSGINEIYADPFYLKDEFLTPAYALQWSPAGFGSHRSPSVDAANTNASFYDQHRPPGRGLIRGDQGAYGGNITYPDTPTTVSINNTHITNGQTVYSSDPTPAIHIYTGTQYTAAGNIALLYEGNSIISQDGQLDYMNGGTYDGYSHSSASLESLGEGTHQFTAKIRNILGIESDGFNFTYVVQETAPTSRAMELDTYQTSHTFNIPFTASSSATEVRLYYRHGSSGAFTQVDSIDPTTANYFTFNAPDGDGLYQFYTRALDASANIEDAPATYDAQTTIDTVNPSSSVSSLAQYQPNNIFTVSWSGTDITSGIDVYDIQYRNGGGAWTDWQTNTTATSGRFSGESDHTYYFRARAHDQAGNIEPYPGGQGNTHTTVNASKADPTPPANITDLKIIGSNSDSFQLQWTAPGDDGNIGTAASYDLRYSLDFMTSTNFNKALSIANPIPPSLAGSIERMDVPVFTTGRRAAWADQDVDGLTDYMESILFNSNPTNDDTDGDGYPDGTENYCGYPLLDPTPARVDYDGDGLIDEKEIFFFNTDPLSPDTDDDGFSDLIEINNHYSPLDPNPEANWDEDGDGLTNYEELNIWHTSAENPDTDNDGYNDLVEVDSRKYNPVNVFYFGIKTIDAAGNKSDISNIANGLTIL